MISIFLFGLVTCATIKSNNPFASPKQTQHYQTEVAGRKVEYFITSIASGQNYAITEGDIVLGEIPASSVPSSGSSSAPQIILHEPFATMDKNKSKRSAFIRRTWPDKTLKYSWGNVKESSKNDLIQAMKDWNRLNGIIFQEVPLGSNENHVEMVDSDGCWSSVGMNGGKQTLGLSVNCRLGAARHELAHALGFIHEQCRPDRDNYIDIHWDRIESDAISIRKDGSWINRNDEISPSDVAGVARAYSSRIIWHSSPEGDWGENCDSPNDDNGVVNASGPEDCQKKCFEADRCNSWAFWKNGNCYLKTKNDPTRETFNPAGNMYCGLVKPKTIWHSSPEGDWGEYCDAPNDDNAVVRANSPQECQTQCFNADMCNSWALLNGNCYLKTKPSPSRDTFSPRGYRITCGLVKPKILWHSTTEGDWGENCDSPGDDTNLLNASGPQDCQSKCAGASDCNSWAFMTNGNFSFYL